MVFGLWGCVSSDCVLGIGPDNCARRDGEIYDPAQEAWLPMPAAAHPRGACDVVPVAVCDVFVLHCNCGVGFQWASGCTITDITSNHLLPVSACLCTGRTGRCWL